MTLEEITTTNNNQLEHVLLDKSFSESCFATAYFNLGSDHKSVVVRMGKCKSDFTTEFLEKLNFDVDHHQHSKTSEKEKRTNIEKEKQQGKKNHEESRHDSNLRNNLPFVLLRFSNPPRKNLCFSNAVISCLLNIPILKKFLLGYTRCNANITPLTEELGELSENVKF